MYETNSDDFYKTSLCLLSFFVTLNVFTLDIKLYKH